ncbi:MAG: hypothetical protein M1828_003693 [Chrysothrix sp. TS-e1954]|nr:MAG: hypothetical protein M1828_003693 [Chrysothrix sp. TS-e1954]
MIRFVGESSHDWRGPLVIMRQPGIDHDPLPYHHAEMSDLTAACDYFGTYMEDYSEDPINAHERRPGAAVECVRINNTREMSLHGQPHFEQRLKPPGEFAAMDSWRSAIAYRVGVPLVIGELAHERGDVDPSPKRPLNIAASNLSYNIDMNSPNWGWHNLAVHLPLVATTAYLAWREDMKPLQAKTVEDVSHFCESLEPMFEDALGRGWVQRSKKEVMAMITSREFELFQCKRSQEQEQDQRKQTQRSTRIASLPSNYTGSLTTSQRSILTTPIASLVSSVHSSTTSPLDILRTYSNVALRAQEQCNCLTEVMLPDAEDWCSNEVNLQGPLAGIPVSLKDSLHVKGFDTSVGYSRNTDRPQPKDGIMVRLLKQVGAVPFVKTNLPITLLSFESSNSLWGTASNPHNAAYTPGGSTGGEGALIAFGGSRIGIGSDVAGSVRAPAHFSGIYALRCSTGRWPKGGMNTSMPGQEGVASVFSPMARTLDDLTYFTREFLKTKPWRLDHGCHPLEWRDAVVSSIEQPDRKLKIGIMRTDGVVDPSPACARALQECAHALQQDGHTVFDITSFPSAFEGLKIASTLLNSDGHRTFLSFFRSGEWNDPGAAAMVAWMRVPRVLKWAWVAWTRYVRRDELWASLLEGLSEKSAFEQWKLVARREAYRAEWHAWWAESEEVVSKAGSSVELQTDAEDGGMDAILSVPNATPAVPHGGMKEAVSACGYTFLWNLLDYTAGVLPVTKVDREVDAMPAEVNVGKLNGVARGALGLYDAEKMHGLPVGVQVVGRRLEEEKVLAMMGRVEAALERWREGGRYEQLEIE